MYLLIRAPQISGFDPGLASVRPAYPSPPFAAFANPIVQGPRCGPGCHFNLDRRSYFSTLLWCSLPVLVVDDIHVHCHPARFVLSQIDSPPAHHAPVVDAPPPAADVSRLKPHSSIRTRMLLIRPTHMPQKPTCTFVAYGLRGLQHVQTARKLRERGLRKPARRFLKQTKQTTSPSVGYMSMPPLTPHTWPVM